MTFEQRQRTLCVAADYLTVSVAFLLFNIVRFHVFCDTDIRHLSDFLSLRAVVLGQAVIPPGMMLLFYLSGYYYDMTLRSRAKDLISTLITTFVGAFVIYFALLVNDPVDERGVALLLLGSLWMSMFLCVFPVRLLISQLTVKYYYRRHRGYHTLIIGSSSGAVALAHRLNASPSMRFNIVGLVSLADTPEHEDSGFTVYPFDSLDSLIRQHHVSRLIVMPHRSGADSTQQLINSLFPYGLQIYVQPSLLHLVSGRVYYPSIYSDPLVNITEPPLSPSQASGKRFIDIVVSTLALVLLLPLFLIVAIAVKLDSRGPVFYTQERIGKDKRPFMIIKFRSMCRDAESNGPALSSLNDRRVTRIGRYLRRYRIDELPQFINVIKGDMSLVGPRPERRYYIDQILTRAPHFSLIHQMRPGITSLGMVKFGYASSVSQMIRRWRYDLLYMENASLTLDFKILAYTVRTVFTGRGV